MADRPPLEVVLCEVTIGTVDADLRFTYDEPTLGRHAAGTPLLSCSLPLGPEPMSARTFFDGVLPEGQHRAQSAAMADVAASDTYGLLERYGRDIAGAVRIVRPEFDDVRMPSVVPLSAEELAAEIQALPERALGVHHDSELSLAGLQDKLLLVAMAGGGWGRPVHGHPSTHIVKLDHQRHRGIVGAEAQCMALARAAGLTTVAADAVTIGGVDCLMVERFDRRRTADGTVERVHQEDTCQALRVSPTHKYEVGRGGGGPEFSQIAGLLDRYAADPISELDRLAAIAAFTAVIGNADAHGKNLAFVFTEPGVIDLAPLYDQVPTRLWPSLNPDAAMTIAGGVDLDRVDVTRISAEAKLWRHSPRSAAVAAVTAIEAVREATVDGTIDPDGEVAGFVRPRAERFLVASADRSGV